MSEFRKDPVMDRWIILSTERGKRPNDFAQLEDRFTEETCPFCPGQEGRTPPEIAAVRSNDSRRDGPGWSIRVFPNKFPALHPGGNIEECANGPYERMNGVGVHEVVVETPGHGDRIADLSLDRISEIFRIFRERLADLKKDGRLRHVLIFKNHGRTAGATREHPHWQLIATPMVPNHVLEELEGARKYHSLEGRCVYCDMIDEELREGKRLICRNDRFVSIEAYASRFPFETWILPLHHVCQYGETEEESIPELAAILKETMVLKGTTPVSTGMWKSYPRQR
jgi:UDPglucose--hexose-1-phosphate uridylyltransferase